MASIPRPVTTQVIPYIFYRDVPAALEWLTRVFGFTETFRHDTPRGTIHAQVELDGQVIMMGQGSRELRMESVAETGTATQGVFIYLADVNAHHRKAVAEGAPTNGSPKDVGYGLTYTAHDPEGHPWFFTTPPERTD